MTPTYQLHKKIKTSIAFLATAVTLFAGNAQARQASTATDLHWPEVNESYLRVGEFADPRDIRRVIPTLPKREVRLLINHPNFSEGLFEVREWDYVFNFLTGKGNEYITCQYKVLFDKDMRVTSTHWRDHQCEAYLTEKPAAIPAQKLPAQAITVSADGLFAFGKSGLYDLQASGRENLQNIVQQLKTQYTSLRSIDIVGHTDRIGNSNANSALSIARANTVKQYFVSQGIAENVIHTSGMGSVKPVVYCEGQKSASVIACLMPNRRIEVTVSGEK